MYIVEIDRPTGGPTVEDLRKYRREHNCSLVEACRALGWKGGTQIRRVPAKLVPLETP